MRQNLGENAIFEENSLRQADLVPLALCAMRHLARKGPGRTGAGMEVNSVEKTDVRTKFMKIRRHRVDGNSENFRAQLERLLLHFAKTGGLL